LTDFIASNLLVVYQNGKTRARRFMESPHPGQEANRPRSAMSASVPRTLKPAPGRAKTAAAGFDVGEPGQLFVQSFVVLIVIVLFLFVQILVVVILVFFFVILVVVFEVLIVVVFEQVVVLLVLIEVVVLILFIENRHLKRGWISSA